MRSIYTFSILIVGNYVTANLGDGYFMPIIVVACCMLHVLLVGFVLVKSLIEQVKKKCNDRTAVVNKMFKIEEQLKAADNDEKEKIEKGALL